MRSFTIPEQLLPVTALNPATDAAGRTGDWVGLSHYGLVTVVVTITQGNAATVALTIEQAKTNAGGDAKAITVNVPIWANEDVSVSAVPTRQADGVSYTTTAALKTKQVYFQIDPATLDLANGFKYITVKTGASNAANITSAVYLMANPRYSGVDIPDPTL